MDTFTEEGSNSKQVSRFFITENNPTEESIERYKEINCIWIAICKEHEDDENKTPHIHIAIAFNGRRRFSTIKKLFPRADIRMMRGTPQDCVTYMTKENQELLFEKGERPILQNGRKKGNETNKKKWEEAYELAKQGRFDEIPKDLYVCHDRAFHRIYEENLRDIPMDDFNDDDLKDHFLWLYGPTGTGKSYWARKIARMLDPDSKLYLKECNKWWNGYKCNWVTLIEETDPDVCTHLARFFKKWCDKYETAGEVKNGNLDCFRPHYIIVTSNYTIEECFPNPNDYGPLKRRFTEIYLDKKYLEVQWPKNPEIKQKCAVQSVPVGNISPRALEQPPTGLEPEAKRQKIDNDVNETGLIDPPAILENTPEDFNSEEC